MISQTSLASGIAAAALLISSNLVYADKVITHLQDAEVGRRVAAAPGVIEPADKEREISAQVIGIIREFRVAENEPVKADEVIAVVENSEQSARLSFADAQLTLRRVELTRTENGARSEELREASAALEEADASLEYANRDYNRRRPLVEHGVAPRAMLDQLQMTLNTAKARRAVVAQRLSQLTNGARKEDIEAAHARLKLAEAEVAIAKAALEKTYIRSPVSGILLRRSKEVGETVTNLPPTTVAVVGDPRGLRVRVEIDESDVGKVSIGQKVEIVSDAFPGKIFSGKISWVSGRMGQKGILTGRAGDKIDTRVLQILVDLEPDVKLPIGLRVDCFIYEANQNTVVR